MNSDILVDMKTNNRDIFKNHLILEEEDEDYEYYSCLNSKNDKNTFPDHGVLEDTDLQEINQWNPRKNPPSYKVISNLLQNV